MDSPDVLVVDGGHLTAKWPFLGDRLREELVSRDLTVMWESLLAGRCLREVAGIAEIPALVLLDVEPGAEDIAAMPELAVVAGVIGRGPVVASQLAARGIPYVDGSRGHSYSRAEMAVALTLSSLRQIPGWHVKVAVEGPAAWPRPSWQCSDHLGYVNGTLRGKHVVVAGLDPVGTHVAHLCSAFGAVVSAADPAAEDVDFLVCDVQRVAIDETPRLQTSSWWPLVRRSYGCPRAWSTAWRQAHWWSPSTAPGSTWPRCAPASCATSWHGPPTYTRTHLSLWTIRSSAATT
ncbi:hypothetical protein [Nocardia veterana]|uniref:Uncharacterized protein n=1 Tax=Nocardia veterana TaxID=132249 RepID=A0A7X6M1C8_9NOCA|nr:hypothetical protein [Nocardia veterana]NKY87522.1 hypothetical protein [Nocardia veterana]